MDHGSTVTKRIHIEIITKFNPIHEKEWIGDVIYDICKRYGVSRKTHYKWNKRYKEKGIEGLSNNSRSPHNIKYKQVTSEVEETILDLGLSKRFGCNRIKFLNKKFHWFAVKYQKYTQDTKATWSEHLQV